MIDITVSGKIVDVEAASTSSSGAKQIRFILKEKRYIRGVDSEFLYVVTASGSQELFIKKAAEGGWTVVCHSRDLTFGKKFLSDGTLQVFLGVHWVEMA